MTWMSSLARFASVSSKNARPAFLIAGSAEDRFLSRDGPKPAVSVTPLSRAERPTSGTGSNCIDLAFSINTGGTYGTAAALATCGENNINGPAPWYTVPAGTCSSNGIGSLVQGFRIGTVQA